MIRFLKSLYNALGDGAYLSAVASQHNDPESLRKALLQAMGISPAVVAVEAAAALEERELIAA